MKVAVVGRATVVASFAAAGLEVVPVEPGPEAAQRVQQLIDSGSAIVFYTEDLQPHLAGLIDKYSHAALPCLSMLPMGGEGAGLARLSEIVKRAVGADVFGAGK
jgi:vacuolar-type H+-ATPase subunit F/Vma7